MMDITAIISHKDRFKNLQYCIASIRSCKPAPRIIIVDFGSKEDITKIIKEDQNLSIYKTKRNTEVFNKSRANNIGIKQAKTEFVCMTDADQVFNPNFFGIVYQQLQSFPKSLILCKTYLLSVIPKGVTYSRFMQFYSSVLYAIKKGTKRRIGTGCCMGIKRDFLLRVGGFDETFIGWGGEDRDLELRVNNMGITNRWITDLTDMIHLPHDKKTNYHDTGYIKKNLKEYDQRTKTNIIKVNENIKWGEL